MSIMMYMLRHMKNCPYYIKPVGNVDGIAQKLASSSSSTSNKQPKIPKSKQSEKILREKTPIGKLDDFMGKHPYEEKEPLPPWPNNTNPHTGEIGGPRGPEPTRYGDWERKGRVSDF